MSSIKFLNLVFVEKKSKFSGLIKLEGRMQLNLTLFFLPNVTQMKSRTSTKYRCCITLIFYAVETCPCIMRSLMENRHQINNVGGNSSKTMIKTNIINFPRLGKLNGICGNILHGVFNSYRPYGKKSRFACILYIILYYGSQEKRPGGAE